MAQSCPASPFGTPYALHPLVRPECSRLEKTQGKPCTRQLAITKEDLLHLGNNLEDAKELAHHHWQSLLKMIGLMHSDDPVEQD